MSTVAAAKPVATQPAAAPDERAARSFSIDVLRARTEALAPVPGVLWLAGCFGVAMVVVVRIIRARRFLRSTTPATDEVRHLLARAARAVGLRRVPDVAMVSADVSPMVYCGMRPLVVLPADLWHRLDERARLAVLIHELAHVRRRDHWFCWAQTLVSVLFWWHPIAWWAQARVRDEAEAACDAWVVAAMPGARREYAEALVVAKSSLQSSGPGVGPHLSVVSAGVSKLSRRITMVMTQRVAPRASMVGVIAAALIAAAGVLATPGLACPPEASQADSPVREVAGRPSSPFAASMGTMGGAVGLDPSQPADSASADRLARTLELLETRLRALEQRLDGGSREQPAKTWWRGSSNSVPSGNSVPEIAEGYRLAAGGAPEAEKVQGTELSMTGPGPDTASRSYSLSEGKLASLIELMSRQDVPIWIVGHDDHIEVYATPAQHEAFAAFIKLIEPGAQAAATPDEVFVREGVPGTPAPSIVPDAARSDAQAAVRAMLRDLRDAQQRIAEADVGYNRAAAQLDRFEEKLSDLQVNMAVESANDPTKTAAHERQLRVMMDQQAQFRARMAEARRASEAARAAADEIEERIAKMRADLNASTVRGRALAPSALRPAGAVADPASPAPTPPPARSSAGGGI